MHEMVLYGPNHRHHGLPFKSDTTPCSAHNDGIGINDINHVHALIANGLQHPALKEAANMLLMTMNKNANSNNNINNNMTSSAAQPSSQQQPSSSNNNAMLSSASLLHNDNFFLLSNKNNIHTKQQNELGIVSDQDDVDIKPSETVEVQGQNDLADDYSCIDDDFADSLIDDAFLNEHMSLPQEKHTSSQAATSTPQGTQQRSQAASSVNTNIPRKLLPSDMIDKPNKDVNKDQLLKSHRPRVLLGGQQFVNKDQVSQHTTQSNQQQQVLRQHQLNMQERLHQVSQQQIEQFCLAQRQQIFQQQEQLKKQYLAQEVQRLLQQSQTVVQGNLQNIMNQAGTCNIDIGCSTSSTAQGFGTSRMPAPQTSPHIVSVGATPNLSPRGQHQKPFFGTECKDFAPLRPNKRKRAARSISCLTHNSRADDSSTVDCSMTKKQSEVQVVKEGSFHHINMIDGRPTHSSCVSSSSQDEVGSATTQLLPPIVSSKQIRSRQVATPSSSPSSSLQDHLDKLLISRGYNPTKLCSTELGYCQSPSPLQLASFGFAVCSSIKPKGADRLNALLQSGLSPNPTNKFGDSPFFMACKRGLFSLVKVFIDNGANVRVADGFGRTPFHYVAWANPPSLESARLLMSIDAKLFLVKDARGKLPLDYVCQEFHSQWIELLEEIKDEMWPIVSPEQGYCPEVRKEDSIPSTTSKGATMLSVELAEKVASGHIMPQDAARQQKQHDKLE